VLSRRVAVEELRALLLEAAPGEGEVARPARRAADRPLDWLAAAQALADVAERHHERVQSAGRVLLSHATIRTKNPRGALASSGTPSWSSTRRGWSRTSARATSESRPPRAKGSAGARPRAVNAMMVSTAAQHAQRSLDRARVRVDKEMLRQLYQGELQNLRRSSSYSAPCRGHAFPIVVEASPSG
jgi:hypothetical protein